MYCVGRNAVCDLRGGVIVKGRITCDHTSKKCHINRRCVIQRILVFFFIIASVNYKLRKCLCLRFAHKEQCIGAFFGVLYFQSRIFKGFCCFFLGICHAAKVF